MTSNDQTPEPQRPIIKGKTVYNDKSKLPKKQPNERQEEDDGIDPILWDVVQRGLARFAREAEDRERRIFYQNNPHIKPQVPRVLIEEAMAKPPAPPKHKPVQAPQLPPSPGSAFPDTAAQFNPPNLPGQQNPAQGFPGSTVPKSAADAFAGTRQSNDYGVPDHHFEVKEPKDKLHPLGLPDDTYKLAYNPQGIKPYASSDDSQRYDVPPTNNDTQPPQGQFEALALKGDNNAPMYQFQAKNKSLVDTESQEFMTKVQDLRSLATKIQKDPQMNDVEGVKQIVARAILLSHNDKREFLLLMNEILFGTNQQINGLDFLGITPHRHFKRFNFGDKGMHSIYQDGTNTQMSHFWGFVNYGYFVSKDIAKTGNLFHEVFSDRNNPGPKEDYTSK